MTISPLVRARRGLKILSLFFSLVMSFFLQYMAARFSGRSYDFFENSALNRKRAIRIRKTSLAMGGVLIKVGQFLSSRVDLLPIEYIEELALLQDEVPGVSFAEISKAIETELHAPVDTVFSRFDRDPVAAASLGQVHSARLRTGQEVAVKVQRPGIDTYVEADLGSVRYIVRWLDRHTPIRKRTDLPEVLKEFEYTLRLELDYLSEGHHAERLATAFADNTVIVIPKIYWSHSTRRVLTLQFMPGVKLTDFQALERHNISRPMIAESLMRAYLQQILQDGFFHADPHPGNILVQPGSRIVLLDFGMVGQISPHIRENIRQVFLGVVRRDFDSVIASLVRLGFVTRDADVRSLKRAIAWTVDTFYEMSLGELKSIDPRKVIEQLQDVLFSESVRIPANYAFLGRALGTLSGVCTSLDPSFQFVNVAEPYARALIRGEGSLRETLTDVLAEVRSVAMTAYSLPFLTHRVLDDVRSGEMSFQHQFVGVVHAVDRLERTGRRILHGLFVIGFLTVGILVYQAHYHYPALAAFALSALFFLIVLISFRRHH
ncbi:MAG: AarF/ABC1/UbiB kinase family protein [Chloroflexota bacterium]